MAYYAADSYFDYGDYQSDSRRNSNSFSEETNGAKRKKTNWGGRGRGGGSRQFSRGGGNRKSSPRNITIDTPLYPEPKRAPPPRQSPVMPVDGRKRGRERLNSARFASNIKPYFDVREMPEFIEPEHTGPAWQWDNYVRGCKDWQDKHKLAYYQSRCMALEFENQMLFEQINQLIKENIVFAAERGMTPTMEVPNIPGYGSQEAGPSGNKNQEKEKIEKAKGTSKAKVGKNEGAPKKPVVKRKEELEQLYGKNSTLIQGLETSLMLNFNQSCDMFKPEIYPAAPLNPQTVVG